MAKFFDRNVKSYNVVEAGNTLIVAPNNGSVLVEGYSDGVRFLNETITTTTKFGAHPSLTEYYVTLLTGSVDVTEGKSVAQISGVSPVVNDPSAAASNTAAIQDALNSGGIVKLDVSVGALVYINASLVIGSNTTFDAGNAEIIPTTAIGNLLRARADTLAGTSVTVTWSSGMTASVAWTGHGKAVGDWVWLNRADQGQFNGVFQVSTVTDANNFVVLLARQPTVTATGSIVARAADTHVQVLNGIWNYNNGTNTSANTGAHTIQLAGIFDLQVSNILAKNTRKYVLSVGAVATYKIDSVGGDILASDAVKVYGPAFNGTVSNLFAGSAGDDIFSAQTKEPPAFVAYDFCQGDILGLIVDTISGKTTTSAAVLYGSSHGVIDGVELRNLKAITTPALVRMESLYATGAQIGTVKISSPTIGSAGQNLISLGETTNAISIKSLVIDNPVIRSNTNLSRLIAVPGSAVTADITVNGGYLDGIESIINQSSGSVISININGMRVGASFQTFRAGASGTMAINIKNTTFESNPAPAFINNNAGTPTIRLRAENCTFPANPVITLTGTPVFSVYSWDLPVDVGATGFVKTINGQYAMNTSAGGARGTLVANRLVTCNGTNWIQVDTPANNF